MAFITADRVLDSSTSTGTGAFVVSGTPTAGYQTFSAVMSVGDTCYYSIQGQTTSEWEVGLGTYSSANTLTRTTVYSSSNSGSAVTFSAGTKNVFITMAASKSPQLDPSGNVTALGTPASISLANATSLPLATGVTGTLSANNGGSVAWQTVQTASFTAVAGNAYPVNTTSAAITVTLPASPSAGNIVQLTDYAGTWSTNNVTVAPNGSNINGASLSFYASAKRGSAAFVYIDPTQGWVVYSVVNTVNPSPYSVPYVVIAGGAGGGGGATGLYAGGGGGAGGYRSSVTGESSGGGASAETPLTLTPGTSYTITVGAGGAGGAASTKGASGSNSVFGSITSTGGGGGGANSNVTGISGGSGGGGGGNGSVTSGGSGTTGQGYAGAGNSGVPNYFGGGGGGAGSLPTSTTNGNGGNGVASSITGTSVTRGGGGGAGSGYAGGSGGGGAGAGTSASVAGTANTGGGGGAGTWNTGGPTGSAGGSGVVILSIPTVFYSGATTGSPTVTTSGSNTILTFTASGSYTA